MSVLELREAVLEEIRKNVALELVKDRAVKDASSYRKIGKKEHSFTIRTIENIERKESSLQAGLLFQLMFIKSDEIVIEIAKLIIQNLDKKGFNIVPITELISTNKKLKNKYTTTTVKHSLKIVRNLYPKGCAFNKVENTLLFQLNLLYKEKKKEISAEQRRIYSYTSLIIKEDFTLFSKDEKYIRHIIKKKYKESISINDIRKIFALVKKLNPYPGYLVEDEENTLQYIIPDVFIISKENKLEIRSNTSFLPSFKISNAIKKIAELDDEAGKFAKEKIEEGKAFIFAVEERFATLFNIVEQILIFQKDFFYYGISFLAPLRQKDVAKALKLSNSTVSRIVNNKYLSCKWGTFQLSYFFTKKMLNIKNIKPFNSTTSYLKTGYSRQACKEIIKNIIAQKPISDREIADILSRKGIKIARRTIAKYRKELGLTK